MRISRQLPPVFTSLRRGSGIGAGGGGSRPLIETVLHHADFDPVVGVLGCGLVFPGSSSIAHAHHIDAVGRNLMIENQVTHDRICHPP